MRRMILLCLIFVSNTTLADDTPAASATKTAIDRGLVFLAKDALAWKAEHNCVSCHHAALVAWSMQEAKLKGHTVNEAVMNEMTKWVAESGSDKTSLPRPAGIPKALNTKPIYFAIALNAVPKPDESVVKGLKVKLETIEADQQENGSWASWPDTRPPFFGNSDDTMTALATLALLPAAAADHPAAKATRDKAFKWLAETKTDGDPQSVAMRLLVWSKLGRPAAELQPQIQVITERQNADGGWSQAKEMSSDAWATGQALYALSHAGLKSDDPVITRGQAFLVKTQLPDGSWPMTSRPIKPDGKGSTSLIPIVGGGSSWAVLGLVRSN